MFKTFLRLTLTTAAIATAPTLALATTNLVQDGTFTEAASAGSFATYSSGQTIGPWTVTGEVEVAGAYGYPGVDLIGTYWQSPPTGGGSVDLDGNAPGGLSQTLSLTAGKQYELSFYFSGNPDGLSNGASPTKIVDVTIGSDVSKTFTYTVGANSESSMNYQLETVKFFAGSQSPTTLSFASQDNINSPWGPVVGGIAVTAVPEPSTWALMLLGFGGLGFAAYRRNRPVLGSA